MFREAALFALNVFWEKFEQQSKGPWYYEQQMLGFNYRMSDLQAALGLSQLERLEEFVEKRNKIATIQPLSPLGKTPKQ